MGWFDWIPTTDEVFDFVECRIGGHKWNYADDSSGNLFRWCSTCNKKEFV